MGKEPRLRDSFLSASCSKRDAWRHSTANAHFTAANLLPGLGREGSVDKGTYCAQQHPGSDPLNPCKKVGCNRGSVAPADLSGWESIQNSTQRWSLDLHVEHMYPQLTLLHPYIWGWGGELMNCLKGLPKTCLVTCAGNNSPSTRYMKTGGSRIKGLPLATE